MYRKAFLADKTTETARRGLGHRLQALWAEFMRRTDRRYETITPLVTALDSFEEIRYPEGILAQGLYFVAAPRDALPVADVLGGSPPAFVLQIRELDIVARTILSECDLNLDVLRANLRPEAREHWLPDAMS